MAPSDRPGPLVMTSDQVSTVHAGSAGVVVLKPKIMSPGYGDPTALPTHLPVAGFDAGRLTTGSGASQDP
jgi:hypothetical protein